MNPYAEGVVRSASEPRDAGVAPATRGSAVADWFELTKPGITGMVVVSAAVGYWMGLNGALDPVVLFHALLGTALSSAGACALNMLIEREGDARMRRTRTRPIPAGRIAPGRALLFGAALAIGGVGWLGLGVGWLAGAISGAIVAGYLLAYTPLKPVSSLSTLVGAQMGAAPPLIGWVAARGELNLGAWFLFAILLAWQVPHILAMAWVNRRDLIEVQYPMAPVFDGDGRAAATRMLLGCVTLVLVSAGPFLAGMAGPLYLAAAVPLGAGFLGAGAAFAHRRTEARARRVFLASLAYLPGLLFFLVLAKI